MILSILQLERTIPNLTSINTIHNNCLPSTTIQQAAREAGDQFHQQNRQDSVVSQKCLNFHSNIFV
jgi:hypothetical protein